MRYGFHVIWISGGLLLISFLLMFLERLDNGGKGWRQYFKRRKADLLFDKILKDPEACERLMQTFYGEIDSDLELVEDIFHRNSLLRHCLMPIKTGI